VLRREEKRSGSELREGSRKKRSVLPSLNVREGTSEGRNKSEKKLPSFTNLGWKKTLPEICGEKTLSTE